MRLGLSGLIMVAMALGAVVGGACHALIHDLGVRAAVADGLGLLTTAFLRAIKMIIAPLVFSTLVSGLAGGATGSLGRIALRAMAWFLAASLVSLAIGLAAARRRPAPQGAGRRNSARGAASDA